jgi:hypothetical protein
LGKGVRSMRPFLMLILGRTDRRQSDSGKT